MVRFIMINDKAHITKHFYNDRLSDSVNPKQFNELEVIAVSLERISGRLAHEIIPFSAFIRKDHYIVHLFYLFYYGVV